MSYSYGAKIEITDFASQVGGGGVNTATNFANLGFLPVQYLKLEMIFIHKVYLNF